MAKHKPILLSSPKTNKILAKMTSLCYNFYMRVINLASGSDGNLTYIEMGDKKILLDLGLTCAQAIEKLGKIGVKPNEISAIIISHEHSDHIKGVDVFSSKFNVPVYAHTSVWLGLDEKLKKVSDKNRLSFENDFALGGGSVHPFEVPHDVKCYGFKFQENNNKLSVVTDLGHLNDAILSSIRGSQLVYLEANYDKKMLMQGTKYPLSLKMRIDGPNGHLSNIDSADAVKFLSFTGTRQIVLSHLSKENNSPSIAYNTICSEIQKEGLQEGEDLKIDVATQNIGAFFKLK